MGLIIERLRAERRLLEDNIGDLTRQITAIAREDAACQRSSGFQVLGRSARRRSPRRSARERRFGRDETWPRGWASSPCKRRRVANPPCSASANAGMVSTTVAAAGAQSVPRLANRSRLGFRAWLDGLDARAHPNVVAIALANKLARIAWAVLTRDQAYRSAVATAA